MWIPPHYVVVPYFDGELFEPILDTSGHTQSHYRTQKRYMEVPAAPQMLHQVLATQQATLTCHEEGYHALQVQQQAVLALQGKLGKQLCSQGDCLHELANSLGVALPAPPVPAPVNHTPQPMPLTVREPKLQLPLRYNGELGKCRRFLSQCPIFIIAQASRFALHDSWVIFILSLLTGTALAWADPLIWANASH